MFSSFFSSTFSVSEAIVQTLGSFFFLSMSLMTCYLVAPLEPFFTLVELKID